MQCHISHHPHFSPYAIRPSRTCHCQEDAHYPHTELESSWPLVAYPLYKFLPVRTDRQNQNFEWRVCKLCEPWLWWSKWWDSLLFVIELYDSILIHPMLKNSKEAVLAHMNALPCAYNDWQALCDHNYWEPWVLVVHALPLHFSCFQPHQLLQTVPTSKGHRSIFSNSCSHVEALPHWLTICWMEQNFPHPCSSSNSPTSQTANDNAASASSPSAIATCQRQ